MVVIGASRLGLGLLVVLAGACVLVFLPGAHASAILTHSDVKIGVTDVGALGAQGGTSDCSTNLVTLQQISSSIDAMDCDFEGEGWGLTYGATDDPNNLWGVGMGPTAWVGASMHGAATPVSSNFGANKAAVEVRLGDLVLHQDVVGSSATPYLFADYINITNTGPSSIGLIELRRCLAWKDPATQSDFAANDLQLVGAPLLSSHPLKFSAIVYGGCQINGGPYCSSANPVVRACRGAYFAKGMVGSGTTAPSTMLGPPAASKYIDVDDDGIEYDFEFENVASWQQVGIVIYYGAAPTGGAAMGAVQAVNADVVALDASPSAVPGAETNRDFSKVPGLTFIYAVGQTPPQQVTPPPPPPPPPPVPPTAWFEAHQVGDCADALVHVTDGSAAPSGIVAWAWTWGDGQTSAGKVPGLHKYAADGVYTIRLRVTDANGATADAKRVVSYHGDPECPPALDPNPDQTVFVHNQLVICWTAHDDDTPAAELRWRVDNLPVGMVWDEESHCMAWIPAEGQLGMHDHILVTVCDDRDCAWRNFAIMVVRVTTPPPPTDGDKDGVSDDKDNCPAVINYDQKDFDGDGFGDRCDSRPCTPGGGQADAQPEATCDQRAADQAAAARSGPDTDGDGIPDARDVCRTTRDPAQGDRDADGVGDACDTDSDDDGVVDHADASRPDAFVDNCPTVSNPDQRDADRDGVGDACQSRTTAQAASSCVECARPAVTGQAASLPSALIVLVAAAASLAALLMVLAVMRLTRPKV